MIYGSWWVSRAEIHVFGTLYGRVYILTYVILIDRSDVKSTRQKNLLLPKGDIII